MRNFFNASNRQLIGSKRLLESSALRIFLAKWIFQLLSSNKDNRDSRGKSNKSMCKQIKSAISKIYADNGAHATFLIQDCHSVK